MRWGFKRVDLRLLALAVIAALWALIAVSQPDEEIGPLDPPPLPQLTQHQLAKDVCGRFVPVPDDQGLDFGEMADWRERDQNVEACASRLVAILAGMHADGLVIRMVD